MNYLHKILVANPTLKEPMFSKSVIFIYQHTVHGYAGCIVNKPGPVMLGELCESKGLEVYNHYEEPLRMGGPIRPQALLVIHSMDWQSDNTTQITSEVGISSDDFMLDKIVHGNEPYCWRLINGISTWGPGQLEAEVDGTGPFVPEQGWLVLDYDYEFLFETDEQEQWELGIEIASSRLVDQYFS